MSQPIDNDIKGKLALVTGASGGIGAACARDLWANGARLVLTYNSNKSPVDELISELQPQDSSRKITAHQCNVTKSDDLHKLYAEIEDQHGQGVDIAVINAGGGPKITNILEISIEDFDYTLNVNLRSAFILSKLVVPYMLKKGWGRVIYISSIAANGTSINGCHYSASKAGVQGLSKNLAAKMGKSGITFNDVAPAMITETGLIRDEDALKGTPGDVQNIPVGRSGRPQECANVVTMLARTGYMTGQSVTISGGLK